MNRRPFLAFLLGLGAFASAGHSLGQSMRRAWPAAKATPEIQLPSVDGQPWRLASERGHVVLLNFWASWCEPCQAEMPALQALAQSQREAGVRIVAVNYREGEPAIKRFLAKVPLQLPVVRDPDGAAARAFGVRIFPSTVAFDRSGRARFVIVGEFDWASAAAMEAIRPLL